ncbi:MAG: SDR family NAD(P)-dependent oxidoreductase [Oscillospiraceae bacterium]|nr:SDR family NAD(P)-dependent oxidoreductase [Oscillospiraceae bacterium]
MNVLVTGGAGYIGSHTCVELLNEGCGVVVIDNLCNSNPKSLDRVRELTGKDLHFYEGDVRDEALLRRIFAENEIDCVIHFAGLKAVGESVAQPWRYYDNNLNSTLVLTKVMEEVGCKKIIFSSSATVYSGDNEMPLRETSKTGNCTNPYGWTKYMTEQILFVMSFSFISRVKPLRSLPSPKSLPNRKFLRSLWFAAKYIMPAKRQTI